MIQIKNLSDFFNNIQEYNNNQKKLILNAISKNFINNFKLKIL